MNVDWEDEAVIKTSFADGEIVISANREGLLSLAGLLSALAGEAPGAHIHLDSFNSLEDGSEELIIERLR